MCNILGSSTITVQIAGLRDRDCPVLPLPFPLLFAEVYNGLAHILAGEEISKAGWGFFNGLRFAEHSLHGAITYPLAYFLLVHGPILVAEAVIENVHATPGDALARHLPRIPDAILLTR